MRACLLLSVLWWSSSVAAQADSLLDARIRRLDSLIVDRRMQLNSQNDRALAAGDVVRMQASVFALEVEAPLADLARQAAEVAWRRLEPRGGSWLSRHLEGQRITVYRTEARGPFGAPRPQISASAELKSDGARVTWPLPGSRISATTRSTAAEGVARLLVAVAERIAWEGTDAAVRTWLLGRAEGTVSVGSLKLIEDPTQWTDVRRSLGTVPSRTNRACLTGLPAGCLSSLGLGDSPAGTPREWYAPEDYHWLAAAVMVDQRDTTLRTLRATCDSSRDAALCERFVRRTWNNDVPPPLGASARVSLLGQALDSGGIGALERLLTTGGTMEARLEAAAGRPLTDVATAWQRRVDSTTRYPSSNTAWAWLSSLGLALAGVAGSARRRLS
jgi:hypothetical protein